MRNKDHSEDAHPVQEVKTFLQGEIPEENSNVPAEFVTMDEYKRLYADFINFRKRSNSEVESSRTKGENSVIFQLLGLLDFMDLFLANNKDSAESNFKFLFSELLSLRNRLNLEPVGQEGELFNPALHEALDIEGEEGSEGTISKVYTRGYLRNGELLRVAIVGVK